MAKNIIIRLFAKLTASVVASDLARRELAFDETSNELVYKRSDNNLVRIGAGGTSAYSYVAYADDAIGTGFSTSPVGKTFVAFRTSTTPLTPVVGDFAGLWRQYVGAGTNGSGLPAKRLYLNTVDGSSGVQVTRVIDATEMRVTHKLLSHAEGSAVAAKNGASGRVYQAASTGMVALSNTLELTDMLFDGQFSATSFQNSAGMVFDSVSDAVFCVLGNNRLAKIANSNFAITTNSVNLITGGVGGIVVAAGRVFVFTLSNNIQVFDTNLNFIQTASVPSNGHGVYNPDRNLLISFRSFGYIEVNPTTFAQNTVSITSNAQCIAYGNGKYAIGQTSDILIVNAATNAIITTLGTGAGVPSTPYVSVIFVDGKFWACGSAGFLIAIDATTNSVVKRLPIRSIAGVTRFSLSSHDVS